MQKFLVVEYYYLVVIFASTTKMNITTALTNVVTTILVHSAIEKIPRNMETIGSNTPAMISADTIAIAQRTEISGCIFNSLTCFW
jgi:hypothetical protein